GDQLLPNIGKNLFWPAAPPGITAGPRQPLGVIRDDEDMRAFFYKLMHETMAVGHAAGVEFPPDFPAELDRSVAAFPSTMKASMANDLDAGKRLELDWLAGKVVALGRKYGISTPSHEAVYAILKPYRTGPPTEWPLLTNLVLWHQATHPANPQQNRGPNMNRMRKYLSLPKIISGHSDDAVRTELAL